MIGRRDLVHVAQDRLHAWKGELQRIDTRFVLAYIVTWQLSLIGSLGLGQLGFAPTPIILGRAEIATVVVMLVTLAAASLLIRELIRVLTLAGLRRVSAELHEN